MQDAHALAGLVELEDGPAVALPPGRRVARVVGITGPACGGHEHVDALARRRLRAHRPVKAVSEGEVGRPAGDRLVVGAVGVAAVEQLAVAADVQAPVLAEVHVRPPVVRPVAHGVQIGIETVHAVAQRADLLPVGRCRDRMGMIGPARRLQRAAGVVAVNRVVPVVGHVDLAAFGHGDVERVIAVHAAGGDRADLREAGLPRVDLADRVAAAVGRIDVALRPDADSVGPHAQRAALGPVGSELVEAAVRRGVQVELVPELHVAARGPGVEEPHQVAVRRELHNQRARVSGIARFLARQHEDVAGREDHCRPGRRHAQAEPNTEQHREGHNSSAHGVSPRVSTDWRRWSPARAGRDSG